MQEVGACEGVSVHHIHRAEIRIPLQSDISVHLPRGQGEERSSAHSPNLRVHYWPTVHTHALLLTGIDVYIRKDSSLDTSLVTLTTS